MSVAKMEARELGNTGLKLSCVGFGASPLGNVFGPVSLEEAIGSVRRAFDLGINFFDTSPYYGGTLSEKILGKCLQTLNMPRSEYIVSTKCGRYANGFDFSAERVTKSIQESLERLQLDYVDILQCHDIEFGSLDQIVSETLPALVKLREAGKIRFIGITGLPLDIFTYVLDRVPHGTAACQAAAFHCKAKGRNISKLSLQYSLSNKDISTVLVGMNSIKQVEENIAAAVELATKGIDKETLSEVEDILKPVKNQSWPSGIRQT
ncbi:unnamed protein product [Rhodiola kirilowii]